MSLEFVFQRRSNGEIPAHARSLFYKWKISRPEVDRIENDKECSGPGFVPVIVPTPIHLGRNGLFQRKRESIVLYRILINPNKPSLCRNGGTGPANVIGYAHTLTRPADQPLQHFDNAFLLKFAKLARIKKSAETDRA